VRKIRVNRNCRAFKGWENFPVIDLTFALEETPDAHRYIDSGRRTGNTAAAQAGITSD
jgi:hypothetical protein|tara:strand:- start:316 stop:489 length:174 start_codon:yes stop_codon:yes gene_type:complete